MKGTQNTDHRFDFRLSTPHVFIIVGVPGSGKTTFAHAFACLLNNSAYLSKDMIQSQFTEAKDINDDLYSSISLPALKLLVTFTDVHCSLGKTPVIDAPFSRNHTYSDERADWIIPFKEIADKHKAPLKILRCQPPNEEEHKRRLKK